METNSMELTSKRLRSKGIKVNGFKINGTMIDQTQIDPKNLDLTQEQKKRQRKTHCFRLQSQKDFTKNNPKHKYNQKQSRTPVIRNL